MLQRVRDLKVQYEGGTLDADDKNAIASEVFQISKEVNSIITDTKFNGKTVFGNSDTFTFQVGANQGETMTMSALSLGGDASIGGLSQLAGLAISVVSDTAVALCGTGSLATLTGIDTLIVNVSKARSQYGAVQNRLEHRLSNLATYQENLTASESRIRDVDMASEMTNFTKLNILQQAGTSMLAQANQSSQTVLSLLR
jgi:flagellin